MEKSTAVRSDQPSREKYLVPVLLSAFRILEQVSRSGPLTLSEVIEHTGVAKATAFRVLATLTHLGYVIRDERRRYSVSPTFTGLVSEASVAEGLRRLCLPHMVRLRDRYGETVNLGRLHQGEVQYVEVVPSEYALRLHETPGATVSLHASGLGRAILAFSSPERAENLLRGHRLAAITPATETDPDLLIEELDAIRKKGFARDRGAVSSLANCVAAPILDLEDRVVGAISISGPASRFDPPDNAPVIEDLLLAASEISQRLGA